MTIHRQYKMVLINFIDFVEHLLLWGKNVQDTLWPTISLSLSLSFYTQFKTWYHSIEPIWLMIATSLKKYELLSIYQMALLHKTDIWKVFINPGWESKLSEIT